MTLPSRRTKGRRSRPSTSPERGGGGERGRGGDRSILMGAEGLGLGLGARVSGGRRGFLRLDEEGGGDFLVGILGLMSIRFGVLG